MSNSTINNIPDVSFIDELTIEELQNTMIQDFQNKYKEITGEEIELAKADPYRLMLYACSLQQYQAMQYIDIQGKMNLLKYSTGVFLDQIAALRGISRNQGTKASTNITFYLQEARASNTSIPEGTRLSVGDVFFLSTKYVEIVAGFTEMEVKAECSEIGTSGNGYLPGEIKSIVDSVPYISKAINTTPSDYGTEIESDESFVDRIYLAPSQYSVAGPEDAYIYFAKEYNSLIADVKVTSPSPTVVDIRFVLIGGKLPEEEMIEGLTEYLSSKNRRPLTDHVVVAAPNTVSYNVDVSYYINESDKSIATTIQKNIEEAVGTYTAWQDVKIGRDINPSSLVHQIMIAGAKRVEVISPVFIDVTETDLPQVGTINIVYGGIEND